MQLNHVRRMRSTSAFIITGVIVMVLGLVGLLGWVFDIAVLESTIPKYATMKFNTSSSFFIAGIAFILLIKHEGPILKSLFYTLTCILGIFAVLTLSQDVFGYTAGIDQFIVTDTYSIAQQSPFPGRMSPSTSLCFAIIAIAFAGIVAKNRQVKSVVQYLLHVVTLISFIALIAYLLQVPDALKVRFFSSMSINTAVTFLILSIMATRINDDLGLTGIFTGNTIGALVARKLFPKLILILIVTAYVSITLQRYQYITAEFGAVMTTVLFSLVGILISRNTLNEMNKIEQQRSTAERQTLGLNKRLEEMVFQQSSDLRDSHDMFVKLFETNPTGIAISKLENGEYIDVNPAMLDILKYTREEMIGHTSAALMVLDRSTRQRLVDLLHEHGQISNADITLQDREGTIKHCIFSTEKLTLGDSEYVISFTYDITDRRIIEDNLNEAHQNLKLLTKQLTKQNDQLRDFAHITSHNLRAPVSNLNLLLQFYQESTSTADKEELVENLVTVISQLNITLDELLQTISIQEDTAKERVVLQFEQVFNAVIAMLKGQIIESKAIIRFDFTNATTLRYPKIYLESIMLNLISNALKYSAPNRVPEIHVTTANHKGEISLSVKDNGLGIDLTKHQRNLFGMRKTFHRHPQARGIGLFMTKTQIEAMGGAISAESIVNEGSVFKVIFNATER